MLPEFTVLQNGILPALKLGKLPEEQIEPNTYERLRLLDTEDHTFKKANKLSGGQQQRVAIARALINNPLFSIGEILWRG